MTLLFEQLEAATGWRVSPNGRVDISVDETPAEGANVKARATVYMASHPAGHSLDVLYVMAENGERWVEARRVKSPSVRLKRLDGRLRLTIQPHQGQAYCELRQARAKGGSWANLYKATLDELSAGAGVGVHGLLGQAGAHSVGSRADVLGDTDRRRTFLCVRFDRDAEEVPIVAFLLTRVLPLSDL